MGNCMNSKKGTGKPLTLAILGLDNAGKTVTTKGLQGESLDTVAPTVGFTNVEFRFNDYDITMFDLGGGKKIRSIWKNYFAEIYGLVYVVDSSEQNRIEECRSVLLNLLEHPQIQGKPMLLLANKQDVNGALDEMDICEYLGLEEIVNKYRTPCRVEPCSAIMGQGKKLDKSIRNGIAWLVAMIEKEWESLKVRVDEDVKVMKANQAKERRERAERVQKIREEREKKEKEERLARGEPENPESDEEAMMDGGPFKRVTVEELEKKKGLEIKISQAEESLGTYKKEKQLKEEKKRKKERDNNLRKSSKSEEEFSSNVHKSHSGSGNNGGGQYSDNEQDTRSDTPPIPSQKSIHSLPPINSSDNVYSQARTTHSLGRLGQYDSPRPNRRFVKGGSPTGSDEENGAVSTSLSHPPWYKSGLDNNELSSHRTSGLVPPLRRQYGDEMDKQPRKGVLSPLGPLQPLEDLDYDYDAIVVDKKLEKKKKKKKKARKNQTAPDVSGSGEDSMEHNWPVAAPRASRSPRLDTVEEPENESDPGMTSFSQKYNLLDDLPELPSSRSHHSSRRGPNTDYDDDLIT